MLAFLGFCFQAIYTGQSPLENLAAHIADPGHVNVFSVRKGLKNRNFWFINHAKLIKFLRHTSERP